MAKRRTIAVALTTLLCLTLCGFEVALRGRAPTATARAPTDAPLDHFSQTLLAQYPMEHHQTYFAMQPNFDGVLWERRFRTNSRGFRGPEVSPEKAPNQVRVVLMGTCITFGELDDTPDGYAALAAALQEDLQKSSPGVSFEVVNASVPGAYERQHLAQYEALIEDLEPDVVLLEAGTMHITDPGRMLRVLRDAPTPAAPVGHALAAPLHDFFARSAVIRRLYDLQEAQAPFFDKHFRRRDLQAEELIGLSQEELVSLHQARILEPGAALYRRDLARLLTKLRGRAEVVTFPFTHGLPRTTSQVSYKRRASLDIPLVRDAPDVYTRTPAINLALFHRSNDIIQESTVEVGKAYGATHAALQRDATLNRGAWHHPKYYFLTWEEGSAARGRALARHLIAHYRFDLRDGHAVVERRSP